MNTTPMGEGMTQPSISTVKRIRIQMYDAKAFAVSLLPAPVEQYQYTWELLRGLPEKKWSEAHACYRVSTTGNNVQYLLDRFLMDEMDIDDEAMVHLKFLRLSEASATRRESTRWEYLFNGSVPDFAFDAIGPDGKRLPFRHQVVAGHALADAPYFGLLMEQGTGKTKVAINEIIRCAKKRKAEGGPAYLALIICPRTLSGNWMNELAKELPTDLSIWTKRLPSNANGAYELVEGMRAKADCKIWIVNPERVAGLVQGPDAETAGPLELMNFDLCILDECNSIKNPNAKRTKAIHRLAESCKRRVIMTGTIMANSLFDVWSQFQFLQPGCLGYDSFYAFRSHYANIQRVKEDSTFGRVIGFKHLDELKARMARFSFMVKKDQCLDLPPKSYVQIPCDMGETQAALYQEMLDFAVAHLNDDAGEGGMMEAKATIAVIMRLTQITSGFIRTPMGDVLRIPDATSKLDAVREIVQNASGKVIVWARFREDIRAIKEALEQDGVKSVVMHGGVSAGKAVRTDANGRVWSARDVVVETFNADNDVKVFIGDPGTGGVGLTLLGPDTQRCATMVYYSNEWGLAEREQSEDRAHRIGQDKPLTIYDLVCPDTVDAKIVASLLEKRNLSNALKDLSTIKEFLLGTGPIVQRRTQGKADTTTTRHLLKSQGICIPCTPAQEEGCENFDHQPDADHPANEGDTLLRCPHCGGDPALVSAAAIQRFLRSGTVIGARDE